jgi:hypothetical protein
VAILVPVSTLHERTRVDCDLPTYTSNSNITLAMILDYTQRAAQKLAAHIQQYGSDEKYLTLSTTLTTTPSVATVTLPTNTLDVERVSMVIDTNRETLMYPAPLEDWSPGTTMFDPEQVPSYRVIGNTLTLFPTPTTARTLRVYYSVGFTVSSTADVLALRPNWDEFIVQYQNMLVSLRQGKATGQFQQFFADAGLAIMGQLKRDRAGPRQVRDLRTDMAMQGWRGRRGL